ncbi:hypothetical protein ACHAPI_010144 [Fusarium lateritium]
MAKQIKNVALAGASGSLGSKILRALLDKNEFHVTALVRKQRDDLPTGAEVKVVDFDSPDALSKALIGQDALIDATSPDPALSLRLVNAAGAAGVYRLIPAEFGSDPENPAARALPAFAAKAQAYQHIQKLGEEGKITWTAVSNHAFLDWALRTSFAKIDIVHKKVEYLDNGTAQFPWTLLSSVATAVVNILLKPEETKNRICYIYNAIMSTAEIVDLAKQVLGGDGWDIQSVDKQELLNKAMAEMAAGRVTFPVIRDMVLFSLHTPDHGITGKKDDNDLLGVSTLSREEIKKIIQEVALQS